MLLLLLRPLLVVALFRVCSAEGSFFAEGGKEDEEDGDGDGDEEDGDAKDVATRFRDRDIGFAVFLGRLYVFRMPATPADTCSLAGRAEFPSTFVSAVRDFARPFCLQANQLQTCVSIQRQREGRLCREKHTRSIREMRGPHCKSEAYEISHHFSFFVLCC